VFLVGFIKKKFVTMHGHMNVKYCYLFTRLYGVITYKITHSSEKSQMLQLLGGESIKKERRIRITREPPKCVYIFSKKKKKLKIRNADYFKCLHQFEYLVLSEIYVINYPYTMSRYIHMFVVQIRKTNKCK